MSKQNAPVADAPVSLENIEKLYDLDFRGPEARKMVEDFMRAHPELVPLLEEAYEVMRSYLPDATPFIEMSGLYDGPDYHYITVFVRTAMEAKEARKRFREMDDNWFFPLPYDDVRKYFGTDIYYL
jgi:hypothetical protein